MANQYAQEVGTLARVEKVGRSYKATTPDGQELSGIESYVLKNAFRAGKAIKLHLTSGGSLRWKQVPFAEWSKAVDKAAPTVNTTATHNMTHPELVTFIENCVALKPHRLKMSELLWKYVVRAALKGDNIMFLGPSGCGKTMTAYALQKALNRPFFYFNMGATQDPRSELVGNTHFAQDKGTYVAESEFITAISTPNAIILLDEMSRAHPDASNILMTVLDKAQRYLRISEKPGAPVVKVAAGVSFVLTANVGSEYTGTRTMDRALYDRCKIIEVTPLDFEAELELLGESFPDVDNKLLKAIAEIATKTREEVRSDNPNIDTIISTRVSLEMADMLNDGFTLPESAEVCIFPFYSDAGGSMSARAWMRKVVQQYIPVETGPSKAQFSSNEPDTGDQDKIPWA